MYAQISTHAPNLYAQPETPIHIHGHIHSHARIHVIYMYIGHSHLHPHENNNNVLTNACANTFKHTQVQYILAWMNANTHLYIVMSRYVCNYAYVLFTYAHVSIHMSPAQNHTDTYSNAHA